MDVLSAAAKTAGPRRHHEARQLAGDGLLFRLGVMSIPHLRLATCAGHWALIDGAAGRVAWITKTQQCSLAADCSSSGAAHVGVGGGVSYAEVSP
jgi:hypothetical protein